MKKRTQGLALVIVMMALGLLAVTTLGITYLGNMSLVQSKNQFQTDEAIFAAQAGLRVKIGQLKADDEADITGDLTNSDASYSVQVFKSGDPDWPAGLPTEPNLYYILSEGESSNEKTRSVAMLIRKSSSDYNIAALASDKVELKENSYTQTYSSDPTKPVTPSDYQLATVGITDSKGTITIDSDPGKESYVGFDNGSEGKARLYAPPGAVESDVIQSGTAGVNFSSFTIESTLSDLNALDSKAFANGLSDDITADSGDVLTLAPIQDAGPDGTMGTSDDVWEIKKKKIEAKNGGIIILDISMIPDDQVGQFNFKSMEMDSGGQVQLFTGTSEANCQFYVDGGVSIKGGGILNPTAVPSRFEFLIKNGDVIIEDLTSVAYMVVKVPSKKVSIKKGELRGAVVAKEVVLEDGARLFYDKMLTTTNTGASNIIQISYQEL
jgi:Tfp pilus assembly protein PilX